MHQDQLSFNQITSQGTPTLEVLDACVTAGIRQVSLWLDRFIGGDAARTAAEVRARGLTVSSLCRGGFFTDQPVGSPITDANLRAVDDAAALDAHCLVLVCGPIHADGPQTAWRQILDGIVQLTRYARQAGVSLAVEPFHPMLAAERSAIVTLDQATDLIDATGQEGVGIALDTYHVWWDPNLDQALDRALPHVVTVQLGDWLVPTTSLLAGRGLPGDGVADIPRVIRRLDAVGYLGPVEVEVLNPTVWRIPVDQLTAQVMERCSTYLTSTCGADMR